MFAMDGMAGRQMVIRVGSHQQRAHFMCPLLVAETIEIGPQIPRDVRECAQPCGRIAEVATLVLTSSRGLSLVAISVHDCRNDYITFPGKPEHALPFLPVWDVK